MISYHRGKQTGNHHCYINYPQMSPSIMMSKLFMLSVIVLGITVGTADTAAAENHEQLPSAYNKKQLCSGLCICDPHLQHINCTETGIRNLSNIAIPKSVISLMLDKNTIDRIPNGVFERLPKMEFLALRNNVITDIDRKLSICTGKRLNHLFLDFNYISEIPEMFLKDCNELKTLQIKTNYLIVEDVAKHLKHLPMLETLDLSNNQFQNVSILPPEFSALKNLKYLFLNNMEIHHLSEAFFNGLNTSNIIELGFAQNAIVKVSNKSFTDMESLHILDLSYTNINVQNTIDIFTGLQNSLHLHDLRLKYIFIYSDDDGVLKSEMFHDLHNISSLKILHMEGNYGGFHGTLSKNFFVHLRHLEQLYLDHNELRTIHSKTFNRLHKLKKLSLNRNFLSCLVDCQFLQSESMFSSLEYLDLSNNVIDDSAGYVSFTSRYFPRLRHLTLRENRLSQIQQDTFDQLRNLRFLDLSQNPIRVIVTGAFGTLEKLKTLIIEECYHLEFISPRVFSGLNSLEMLKLNDDGIRVLSKDAWEGLTSLLHLELSRNSLGGANDISATVNPQLNMSLPGHNLTIVDLSYNDIEVIPYELLLNQPQLKTINLNHNRIVQLHENRLQNLSKLQSLDLSYNDLLTLTEHSLAGLTQLNRLNIEGNPFYCDDCSFINSDGNWLLNKYQNILYNAENTKCAGPVNMQGTAVLQYHSKNNKIWTCNREKQELVILLISLVGVIFALISLLLFIKILRRKVMGDNTSSESNSFNYKHQRRSRHEALNQHSDSQVAINSIETVDTISQVSQDQQHNGNNNSIEFQNSIKSKGKVKKKGCLFPLFDLFHRKSGSHGLSSCDGGSHGSDKNGFVNTGNEPLIENLHESQSTI